MGHSDGTPTATPTATHLQPHNKDEVGEQVGSARYRGGGGGRSPVTRAEEGGLQHLWTAAACGHTGSQW